MDLVKIDDKGREVIISPLGMSEKDIDKYISEGFEMFEWGQSPEHVPEDSKVISTFYYENNNILHKWEIVPDPEYLRGQVEILKEKLQSDDYKITKCYEAQLLGRDMPYDVATLVDDRQKMRGRINDLEKLI